MPGEQYVFLINPIKSHPSIFNIEYLHVGPSSDYTKPGFLGGIQYEGYGIILTRYTGVFVDPSHIKKVWLI